MWWCSRRVRSTRRVSGRYDFWPHFANGSDLGVPSSETSVTLACPFFFFQFCRHFCPSSPRAEMAHDFSSSGRGCLKICRKVFVLMLGRRI